MITPRARRSGKWQLASWFVYQGSGTVKFDPPQKTLEDTRTARAAMGAVVDSSGLPADGKRTKALAVH
jgi:hypothetical protein